MKISQSDLLPVVFDQIANSISRHKITSQHRRAIIHAVISMVQYAGQISLQKVEETEGYYIDFITSDRFSTEWTPRLEIINSIMTASGLDQRTAHLALTLMEARVDILLAHRKVVSINDIARIMLHNSTSSSEENNNKPSAKKNARKEWYEALFLPEQVVLASTQKSFWLSFHRKPTLFQLPLIEALELGTVTRKPLAYKMSINFKIEFKRVDRKIHYDEINVNMQLLKDRYEKFIEADKDRYENDKQAKKVSHDRKN